jgi:polysaccharide deacetylase family protein (PEP-CTERM system associated)
MKTPAIASTSIRHIMSVDVEDYFQVEAFAGVVSRESWDQYSCRVVDNCRRLLDLFDGYEVQATFFTLGWVAKRFPGLIRDIRDRGHELACHSFWHRKVDSLTPAQFREDTRQACDAIEQAASVRVAGYRAPTWSISRRSPWALEILSEEGFEYDSSIYPIRHDLYGTPGASRHPYAHVLESGQRLLEFPPATARVAGMTLPAAGGGYLRILPLAYTTWVFRQFERAGQPLVLYLHPWEIDPGQPRIRGPFKSRFRHYTNLHRTEGRLRSLLQRYTFGTFRDHLAETGYTVSSAAKGAVAGVPREAAG